MNVGEVMMSLTVKEEEGNSIEERLSIAATAKTLIPIQVTGPYVISLDEFLTKHRK